MPDTKNFDIESIVKRATRNYRKYYNLKDDLYQEGYLAALEFIDKREKSGGKITYSGILGAVKKAVYSYCNLKQLPITVPVNSTTVEQYRKGELFTNISTHELLEETIADESSDFINTFKNDLVIIKNMVDKELDGVLKDVIVKRYFEEKTLRQVAKELDIAPSTVYNFEVKALDIMYQAM